MNEKLFSVIFKINDTLPIIGGASGAVSQVEKLIPYLPTWNAVISTLVLTIIGGAGGYLIKLVFDIIFRKIKKKYKV